MIRLNMLPYAHAGRPCSRCTILRHTVLTLLGLGLACGVTACAPKPVGPTSPSGYFFIMQVSDPVILLRTTGTATEVSVRVQDARGQPVDGVPVTFEVEPGWTQYASVSPSQVTTRGGVARTVFTARTTGVVHVTARVDNTIAQAEITVQSPPSPTGGGASLTDPEAATTAES
jgi:hypothetical protein